MIASLCPINETSTSTQARASNRGCFTLRNMTQALSV